MPQSAAHMRATQKFETKAYDKILLRIRKDQPDASGLTRKEIADAAEAVNESMNTYILKAITDRMKAEQK